MKSVCILLLFLGFYALESEKTFEEKLSDTAISITNDKITYDPTYRDCYQPKIGRQQTSLISP